jgi:hypothetical protein
MKTATVILVTVLSGLMSADLRAAQQDQQDAAGCEDHPLIPRIPGHYIRGCGNQDAKADVDVINGETTVTISLEGRSMVLSYDPQPDLETKPSEADVRGHFANAIEEHGGTLLGVTHGQEWPVCEMAKDGKGFWVVLMINSGEYFTGHHSYRIIEKSAIVPHGESDAQVGSTQRIRSHSGSPAAAWNPTTARTRSSFASKEW